MTQEELSQIVVASQSGVFFSTFTVPPRGKSDKLNFIYEPVKLSSNETSCIASP
jgi:hypothetical protein